MSVAKGENCEVPQPGYGLFQPLFVHVSITLNVPRLLIGEFADLCSLVATSYFSRICKILLLFSSVY